MPRSPHSLSFFHAAIDRLPSGSRLQHITEFGSDPPPIDPPSSGRSSAPMLFSSGLPPVPIKLVKRIQDGLFVEMSELLPERLTSPEYNAMDSTVAQRQKPQEELSIIQWVQALVYIWPL